MKVPKSGVVVVAVLAGAIGILPIARGPGYEFSLLAGLIIPSTAAIWSSVEGSASSEESSLFARALRGVIIGAISAGVALATSFVWAMIHGFCDVVGGVIGYVLTAGMGAVLGGLWGSIAGEIARGRKWRKLTAVVLAFGGPLGTALASGWRFWASPCIFAFDPFVGYFSGTLYDTIIEPGMPLLTYRAASLATIAGTLLLASGIAREGMLVRVTNRTRALAGTLLLMASFGSIAFGPQLGHWQTAETIAKALGGRKSGPRCDVVHPDSLRADEAELLVRDCEADLAEVERVLGARGPERITAFFFRDAGEKKRLMGAADTYIAKPWRKEVYLQVAPYPHPVLGHELAHVVAGSFGRGPFRIAGELGGWLPNPGLIEGVAVAASPDEDELTDIEWARAMKERKLLPPMQQIFSLGFLGSNAAKSYTLAGAFVRWIIDTKGNETVRRWYGGESIEALLGKNWDAIDADFRAKLDERPVLPAAAAYVAAKFDRPAVFGRKCPHEVDALRREGDACRDAHRVMCAQDLYDKVLRRDPHDFHARLSVAGLELKTGDREKGRAALRAFADDEKVPRSYRDKALEALADDAMQSGRFEDAAKTYDDIVSRLPDEDLARTIEVKAVAARDPSIRDGIVALLIGERDRPPDQMLAAARLGASPNPLASYVLGKNLAQHGEYREAAKYLDRALEAPPATLRVGRETYRMRAVCACALGDKEAIGRVRDAIGKPGSPFEGSAGGRYDGLERLLARCVL